MSLTISLDASGTGALALTLPNGSVVTLGADHKVGPLLAELLYAQQAASVRGAAQGLGSASAPTQSMIDDYLFRGGKIHRVEPVRRKGEERPRERVASEMITLEVLGLA